MVPDPGGLRLAETADRDCGQRHHEGGGALPALTGTVTGLENGDTGGHDDRRDV